MYKFTFTADGERLRSVEASCLTKAVEQVPQLAAAKVWSFMREPTDNSPAINLSMVSQSVYDQMRDDMIAEVKRLKELLKQNRQDLDDWVSKSLRQQEIIDDLRGQLRGGE